MVYVITCPYIALYDAVASQDVLAILHESKKLMHTLKNIEMKLYEANVLNGD